MLGKTIGLKMHTRVQKKIGIVFEQMMMHLHNFSVLASKRSVNNHSVVFKESTMPPYWTQLMHAKGLEDVCGMDVYINVTYNIDKTSLLLLRKFIVQMSLFASATTIKRLRTCVMNTSKSMHDQKQHAWASYWARHVSSQACMVASLRPNLTQVKIWGCILFEVQLGFSLRHVVLEESKDSSESQHGQMATSS